MEVTKDAEKIHKELRLRIPKMNCRAGCSECCGPVVFSKWEWAQVKEKRTASSLDCPYIENGQCSIYEDRPIICRLFGVSEAPLLQCPYGCKPGRVLSIAETEAIMDSYDAVMD